MLGALAQLAATAFLLAAMNQRNFVVGVAFSKSDALQVAVRALGMVEVVFSYLVAHRFMRERLAPAEQAGLVLVLAGVAALLLQL